jgi:tetratricopeptide (TPR) repeat protein
VKKTMTKRRAGPVATPVKETPAPKVRPEPSPARGRRTWLTMIPLVLVVAAAFNPVLDNDFVDWDDQPNFVQNPHFRGLGWAQVKWAWSTFWVGVYQPVSWLLFEAQHVVWGLDPRGYHLTSLLLHAVNTVLVYALTSALLARCRPHPSLESPWARALGAGLATAFFAVHPLRVEAVAWVSCQPYLPCALFSMLTVLAYLRAVGDGRSPRWGWMAAAFALFAAALLSHPPAVSLPAVLLILDVYPLRRLGGGSGRWFGASARAVWLEKVPFLALSLVFMGIAVAAKADVRVIAPLDQDGVTGRIAQACYGIWFYLVKTAIPRDITVFYPLPGRIDWWAPRFLLSLVATLAVSAGLFLLRRRWPGLLAAWLSYLVILAPSSGLIRIGKYSAADRYSYLSMIGLVVPVAAGLGLAWAHTRRARAAAGVGVVALAGVAVLGLVPLTRDQCRIWRTSEALWTHALEHAGDSGTAHLNLGVLRSRRGDVAAAKRHYTEANRLDPGDFKAHLNLGTIASHEGDIAAAEAHYAEALRIDPRSVEPHVNLGAILAGRGDFAAAEAEYALALRLNPDHAEAQNNFAMILAACPDAKYRDGPRAIEIATRACELSNWKEPGSLDTLAAAHAEAGDFEAAVRWQTRAIGMLADGPMKDRYRSRLALYLVGKPYREQAPRRAPTGAGP